MLSSLTVIDESFDISAETEWTDFRGDGPICAIVPKLRKLHFWSGHVMRHVNRSTKRHVRMKNSSTNIPKTLIEALPEHESGRRFTCLDSVLHLDDLKRGVREKKRMLPSLTC